MQSMIHLLPLKYQILYQSQGVLRQTDQAYFHISGSPWGACPDGSLESIFPQPPVSHAAREPVIPQRLSMLQSVLFNLQDPSNI